MLEITALMLCKLGGKAGSEDDIKAVMEAAGVADVDTGRIQTLLGDVGDKDISQLLGQGMEKLKDVPMGGGGGGGGGGGAGGGGTAGGAEAEAAKEEDKEEDEDVDMGGGMVCSSRCDVVMIVNYSIYSHIACF